MARRKELIRSPAPKLFNPAVTRQDLKPGLSEEISLSSVKDTNILSTSSFRYDSLGAGLKSTQELSVDWDSFENHTFFNSAQSKVNIAFNEIINYYPFDGTEKEVEAFEDSLTGYERHILNIFPKNTGYLLFSGTQTNEDPANGFAEGLGTRIDVIDSAGSLFPGFSRNTTGDSIIDFGLNPLSIEFQLLVPGVTNDNQIICQSHTSTTKTVSLVLSQSTSTNNCDLIFAITSGSAKLIASSSVVKGSFLHVCATYDRDDTNKLLLYVSESLVASSSVCFEFGNLFKDRTQFIIGSGSEFTTNTLASSTTTFTPKHTLSGALDEFRIFHSKRSSNVQKEFATKEIYASDPLRLYFKFNEPTGSYVENKTVLDSSGNSLHSTITNFAVALRSTGSEPANPVISENISRSPVLFPTFSPLSKLNSELLSSASFYDDVNPNLITKLVPVHYFLEGQSSQGLSSVEGQIGAAISSITGSSIPGSANIGSAHYMTAFLLMWSKHFDELKMFIDHFAKVLHVDYDDEESVAIKLLPYIGKYYGISLPSLFPDASPAQFINGENIGDINSKSEMSLQKIQGEIWKRILLNLNDVIESKGTIHSIKSIIRAAGINPDNLMNIREYGGPTKRSLSGLRQNQSEVASVLDFSGSLADITPSALTNEGFSTNVPYIATQFLSASRIEVGYPLPVGTFVNKTTHPPHGISNNNNDGFLTSGSFLYEGIYQFRSGKYSTNQSLVRLNVSSSDTTLTKGITVANLLLISGTENSVTSSGSTLRLYARPGQSGPNDPLLRLHLTGVNIFDGNLWNVSFGRQRSDQLNETDSEKYLASNISSAGSSSYFLRCARQSFGEIKEYFSTASYFKESTDTNAFQSSDTGTGSLNTSGTLLVIGSQSLASFVGTGQNVFLNDENLEVRTGSISGDYDTARETNFEGRVGQIRFWSKSFSDYAWKEHVRNFKSLGVHDPLINFNFEKEASGSFEKLRLDLSIDQAITGTDSSGELLLQDFSQNKFNVTGSGFEQSKDVIKPETFYFSHLAPKFDLAQTDNKVRVRSYQELKFLDESEYASTAPRYEVQRSEEPDDDTRFSIEFSSVKALDEDIVKMFSDLTFFDNALGAPNLLFDDFYPDLEQIRKLYFQRLTDKPDFQIFFELYKWFSTSIGSIIEQLIPRKTKFLGINFVVESHMIERSKFRYLFDEIYLLSLDRNTDRGNLLLSQFEGSIKKF